MAVIGPGNGFLFETEEARSISRMAARKCVRFRDRRVHGQGEGLALVSETVEAAESQLLLMLMVPRLVDHSDVNLAATPTRWTPVH